MLRRPTSLSALGVACAAAVTGLWFFVNDVAAGRRLDAGAGDALHGLTSDSLDEILRGTASLADTLPFAVAAAGLLALAWLRGGPRLTLACALILLVGNAATQLAQPSLTAARQVDFSATRLSEIGSWPSGHATAAMFLALVAVLVAGPRLRRVTAIAGAGFALAVGGALVTLGGHVPGDVLAGYLVAGAFTALGAAALSAAERRHPRARRPARSPRLAPALGALAALAVFATAAGTALVTRRDDVANAVHDLPWLLAGTALVALAVALTAGWALVRR